jgi:hypothetical protein
MNDKPGEALAWLMFACAALEGGRTSDQAADLADTMALRYRGRWLGAPAPAPVRVTRGRNATLTRRK